MSTADVLSPNARTEQPHRQRNALRHAAAKPILFVVCLLPFAWLLHGALTDSLGANPAEALIRGTGDWVLRLLCVTLAVTPLRQWSGRPELARFRRMLGLFTFFYLVLHFLSYAWLDMGFDPQAIARDIPKRPFALVGFAAFVLMTAARGHLVQPGDQGARREALANAAQARLRDRAARVAALLLDARGEERLRRSRGLRHRRRGVAWLARGSRDPRAIQGLQVALKRHGKRTS